MCLCGSFVCIMICFKFEEMFLLKVMLGNTLTKLSKVVLNSILNQKIPILKCPICYHKKLSSPQHPKTIGYKIGLEFTCGCSEDCSENIDFEVPLYLPAARY